jgi:malonate-semialdehyde dehydrogenase (acetylating)/methylmalonate-semialdehyde dehydrogenase
MSPSPAGKKAKIWEGEGEGEGRRRALNYIGGAWSQPLTGDFKDVISPATGKVMGAVACSGESDVAAAVKAAETGGHEWRSLTVKARAAIMQKFLRLLLDASERLAELVVQENGKNIAEARASVAKGAETVEWACGMPVLWSGRCMTVSGGIDCKDEREPLGTVACVVPFNFPIMVPCWTTPIALMAGNSVILKPSEKVPFTLCAMVDLMTEAGVPAGVIQLVQGEAPVVNALCDHPSIMALSFVGSSRVAALVSRRCNEANKRVLALGGAKNHLVALPDCNKDPTARDIVASFAGCAGQRCMAASVLICVGGAEKELLPLVISRASELVAGTEPGQVGAIIDQASQARIKSYIDDSEAGGAQVLLDGRGWASQRAQGCWIGPTILLHSSPQDKAVKEEIFGPVLSVLCVETWQEALAIENGNPYGNAASIYTSSGYAAEHFSRRFRAGMIGVNIGVPVPREPFAFGGMAGTLSKYGEGDITGEAAMEFFSRRRKVTSRWFAAAESVQADMNSTADVGSFVGRM